MPTIEIKPVEVTPVTPTVEVKPEEVAPVTPVVEINTSQEEPTPIEISPQPISETSTINSNVEEI